MNDIIESIEIVAKLLHKTDEHKLEWQTHFDGFICALNQDHGDSSFEFIISKGARADSVFLRMVDAQGQEILAVASTPLPTSPPEERLSDLMESLYESVRRQVFRVNEKLRTASELLDRA
jgi:hypothetical protein